MPNSPKARAALAKIRDSDAIASGSLEAPLSALRSALRDLELAARDVQYDLADVTDPDDRARAIEAMANKVGGLLEHIDNARRPINGMQRTVAEIERELPRMFDDLAQDG